MSIEMNAIEMAELPEPVQWLVKEQAFIEKIKGYQGQIDVLRALPRSQEEVRREIDKHLRGDAGTKLMVILKQYQAREIDSISPEHLRPAVLASLMQSPTVGELVGRLPQPLSEKERNGQIAALEEEVHALLMQLGDECWPGMRGDPNTDGADGALEYLRDWSWKCNPGWNHPVTGDHMVEGSMMDRVGRHFRIGPSFHIGSFETLQTLRQGKVHPF